MKINTGIGIDSILNIKYKPYIDKIIKLKNEYLNNSL